MKSIIYARQNPYYLMLWLAMAGSFIIFFFILLTFTFRKAGSDYKVIEIPVQFYFSTLILTASSVTLALGQIWFKKEKFGLFYRMTLATGILAVLFCIFQIWGWAELFKNGVYLDSSIFGAFIYILTGLHLAHIFLGLFGLGVVIYDARQNSSYVDGFILSLNPIKLTRIRLVSYFWHFIDVLWWMIIIFLWAQT